MKASLFSLAVLLTTGSIAVSASAAEYINFSAGSFDVLDDDNSGQFGVEYRGNELGYGVLPIVGAFANSDGGVYGYAGLNWDLHLTDNVIFTPNFAVGAYSEGSSKDLGGVLEFRSGVELDYKFENQHRIGVSFNHISNASIYDKNPGEESLLLNYSVPLSGLFRN